MSINLDRGVTMRQIVAFNDPKNPRKYEPDINYGGMAVYMYKDTPGVYFDVHGKEIPEVIAAKAGFPVGKLAKARRRKEAVAALEAEFRRELEVEDIEEETIVAEAGAYKVVALPMGRARVVDRETGDSVTPVPLPLEAAKVLLGELTKGAEAAKVVEAKQQKEGK